MVPVLSKTWATHHYLALTTAIAPFLADDCSEMALDSVSANNLSHCDVVGESGDADPQQAGQKISHDLLLE